MMTTSRDIVAILRPPVLFPAVFLLQSTVLSIPGIVLFTGSALGWSFDDLPTQQFSKMDFAIVLGLLSGIIYSEFVRLVTSKTSQMLLVGARRLKVHSETLGKSESIQGLRRSSLGSLDSVPQLFPIIISLAGVSVHSDSALFLVTGFIGVVAITIATSVGSSRWESASLRIRAERQRYFAEWGPDRRTGLSFSSILMRPIDKLRIFWPIRLLSLTVGVIWLVWAWQSVAGDLFASLLALIATTGWIIFSQGLETHFYFAYCFELLMGSQGDEDIAS